MQYIGRAKIAYDGKELDTMPGASIDIGGMTRKPVVGDYRVGFSEANTPGSVECEISVSETTPIEEINKIVNATVTFRADIGVTYVIRNAFNETPLKITAGEGGKVKVKLTGEPAETV